MGTRFKTKIEIRPSDIDINGHVHSSVYIDYILHARYVQMDKCYNYPMDKFLGMGLSWVLKSMEVNYKRPIIFSDEVYVYTWVESSEKKECKVGIEIVKVVNNREKTAFDGYMIYSMIDMKTGRSIEIPGDVTAAYSI